MSYRVVWRQDAMRRLAEELSPLPLSATRRVATAMEDFDHLLETEPLLEGESRTDAYHRVSLRGPLLIAFRVDEANKIVRIVSARLHRPALQ